MASNYPPKKNVAWTMYFFVHKNDGTIIANPTLTGSNVHVDGNATQITDSTLAVVDSTTGLCSIVLAQATMNGDQIDGTITASDSGAVVYTFKLMTAANTQDEIVAGTVKAKVDLDTIKTQTVTCGAGVTVLASVGTAATSTAQTGDAYAVVAHTDYGNAKLVRSTTPANTLDVSATGEAGLDFNNIKDASGAHTLTNITVPTVTTTGTCTTNTDMLTPAAILDHTVTDHNTADTVGERLNQVELVKTQADKIPASDGTSSWNVTALAAINAEVDTALNTAIPGSPTANSINERIAAIDDLTQASGSGDLAAILVDTGTSIPATLAAFATDDDVADAILARNIEGGSSSGRTVTQALQLLRNKVTVSGGTMSVYDVGDDDVAWSATVTTDAGASPITAIDPS